MSKTKCIVLIASSAFVLLGSSTGQAQQPPPQSPEMTFFVTSMGPGKGADLGGLEGADRHCQTLAQAVGAGGKTWRAYLSTQAMGGAQAVNAGRPLRLGPGTRGPQCLGRDAPGRGVRDQGTQAVEALGEQEGDVTVAAVLAQQRLRVPEHQVRGVRPGQGRVRREQRPALRLAGCPLGGAAGEVGRFAHLRTVGVSTPRLPQRAIGRLQPRRQDRARDPEVVGEIAEPPDAVEGIAHDQQRPALTENLERPRERAPLVFVVLGQRQRGLT